MTKDILDSDAIERTDGVGLRPDGLASPVSYRFDLLPVHALMKMAEVMEEGHRTGHKDHGWTKMSVDDLLNHAIGHIVQHMQDVKDGEDHLSHAMVRLMMAWEVHRMNKQRTEDKYKESDRAAVRGAAAPNALGDARVPRFDGPFASGVIG